MVRVGGENEMPKALAIDVSQAQNWLEPKCQRIRPLHKLTSHLHNKVPAHTNKQHAMGATGPHPTKPLAKWEFVLDHKERL